jgi:hypothetical protein
MHPSSATLELQAGVWLLEAPLILLYSAIGLTIAGLAVQF